MIKLEARMRNFGEAGYMAWIDKPKSFQMAVQARSPESATKKLILLLRVKLAHKLGIEVEDIAEQEWKEKEISKGLSESGEKEINLLQIA